MQKFRSLLAKQNKYSLKIYKYPHKYDQDVFSSVCKASKSISQVDEARAPKYFFQIIIRQKHPKILAEFVRMLRDPSLSRINDSLY